MRKMLPTDRELEALKILWAQGASSVNDICDALKRQGTELAYTTVLSLLQVMEQKGLAGHRQTGKVYAYFAKVERGPTFRALADGFLKKVFDGALDEYLVHALRSKTLTEEELDRLARTISDARSRANHGTKGGKSS
jgi:BlaI family transcriptional regulator, penicillinase repressor